MVHHQALHAEIATLKARVAELETLCKGKFTTLGRVIKGASR